MGIPIGTTIGYTGDIVAVTITKPPSNRTGSMSGSTPRDQVNNARTNAGVTKSGAAVRPYLPKLLAIFASEV